MLDVRPLSLVQISWVQSRKQSKRDRGIVILPVLSA